MENRINYDFSPQKNSPPNTRAKS